MVIRRAKPEDAHEVARVHVRSWQEAYRGLLPDDFLEALRPEDRARRYTFDAETPGAPYTLIALERERVLGFATTGPARDRDAPGLAELYALYVDPGAWGMGVGGRLHERALERMRELGHEQAILWVLKGNQQAARFYSARGWTRDGARRWEEPYGVRSRVIRYRRVLDPAAGGAPVRA